jgi:hypothetical protein
MMQDRYRNFLEFYKEKTVHNEDSEISEKMQKIADQMNISSRDMGGKKIAGPAVCEKSILSNDSLLGY